MASFRHFEHIQVKTLKYQVRPRFNDIFEEKKSDKVVLKFKMADERHLGNIQVKTLKYRVKLRFNEIFKEKNSDKFF